MGVKEDINLNKSMTAICNIDFDEEIRSILRYANSEIHQRSTGHFRISILRSIFHMFKDCSDRIGLRKSVLAVVSALITDSFKSSKVACVASMEDYIITMNYFESLRVDKDVLLNFVGLCFGENIAEFDLNCDEYKLTESKLFMLCWYYDLIGKPDVFFVINDKFKRNTSKHKLVSVLRVVSLCLFLAVFVVLLLQLTIWEDGFDIKSISLTGVFEAILCFVSIKLVDIDLSDNLRFLRKYDDGVYDIIRAKEKFSCS